MPREFSSNIAGKTFTDSELPLDKSIPGVDPEDRQFNDPTRLEWGWFPFLYESIDTVGLGGIGAIGFNFGTLPLSLPSLIPSIQLVGGSGRGAVESPAAETLTFDEEFVNKFCCGSPGDVVGVDCSIDGAISELCKSVLGPCDHVNYINSLNNALIDKAVSAAPLTATTDVRAAGVAGGVITPCTGKSFLIDFTFFDGSTLNPDGTVNEGIDIFEAVLFEIKTDSTKQLLCSVTDQGGQPGERSRNTYKKFVEVCLKPTIEAACSTCTVDLI